MKEALAEKNQVSLSEHDDQIEYKQQSYRPIESRHRMTAKKRSAVVAFFVRRRSEYHPIEFESNIECYLIKLKFDEKNEYFLPYTHQMHFQ